MKARRGYSNHAAVLRRINGVTPLIPSACRSDGPDHTAVATLSERLVRR